MSARSLGTHLSLSPISTLFGWQQKGRDHNGHALEIERQIAACTGLQRRAVTRFGKTA